MKKSNCFQQFLHDNDLDTTHVILCFTDEMKLLRILYKKKAVDYETGIKQDKLRKLFIKKVGFIYPNPFEELINKLTAIALINRTMDMTICISPFGIRYFEYYDYDERKGRIIH